MNDSLQMQILREVYHNLSHTSTPAQENAVLHEEATREAGKLIDVAAGHKKKKRGDQSPPEVVHQSEEETWRAAKAVEQDFAMAVFEIGLRQSSPKVLKGLMLPTEAGGLTTEHIKSHLQKYRLHYERSKEEFLGHYRKFLRLDREDRLVERRAGEQISSPSSRQEEDARDESGARRQRQTLATKQEVTQLVKVQNVHNQLVHEQLELQNTLQSQMHEQLQLQAELNALMRDAANIPLFSPEKKTETSETNTSTRKRRSSSLD